MNTVDSYNFHNKKALVRVDFNVPLNDQHEITDFTRIKAAVPTIRKILDDGGAAILMSHLGRQKGTPQDKFSLKYLVAELSDRFGTDVKFADDCIGAQAKELAAGLQPGELVEVLCTDPGVVHDIPAWCRVRGHEVCNIDEQENEITITIRIGNTG